MASDETKKPTVVIVGAGFAGVACAKELAKHDMPVTLIDRHNYQQFQPLLYQVATAELGTTDVARPIRAIFAKDPTRPDATARGHEGRPWTRDRDDRRRADVHRRLPRHRRWHEPNFFSTPGADGARTSRCIRCPTRRGCAHGSSSCSRKRPRPPRAHRRGRAQLRDRRRGPDRRRDRGRARRPREPGDAEAAPRPRRRSHAHLPRRPRSGRAPRRSRTRRTSTRPASSQHNGVQLMLGLGVNEVGRGRGRSQRRQRDPDPLRRLGRRDPGLDRRRRVLGLPSGRGGTPRPREPDLTARGTPTFTSSATSPAIPDHEGNALPQLGSVALQSGKWAAENILADIDGKPREPFHYKDKGIMAMIGDGAAVAEMGKHHHELHGHVAFACVARRARLPHERHRAHASTPSSRGRATSSASSRASSIIDDPDAARIDWGDEEGDDEPLSDAPPETAAAPAG